MFSEDDKSPGLGTGSDMGHKANAGQGSPAPRARNRTVMLTPEMTGQMRTDVHGDPFSRPGDANPGFERPRGGFQNYSGGGASAFDAGAFGGFGGQQNEREIDPYSGGAGGNDSLQRASGLVEDPYASPFAQPVGTGNSGFGGNQQQMSSYATESVQDTYSSVFGGRFSGVDDNGVNEPVLSVAPKSNATSGSFLASATPAASSAVQQQYYQQPFQQQPMHQQPIHQQPVHQQPVQQVHQVAVQPDPQHAHEVAQRVEPQQHVPVAQPIYANPVTTRSEVTPHNEDEQIYWIKELPLVGFLVSFEKNRNGEVLALRPGRLIVTSEASSRGGSSNYLYINDDTVSPNHAIMKITKHGEIQVLDQLSEHGTRIRRFGSGEYMQLSGDKSTLDHGDVVKFGDRTYHVCVLSIEDEPVGE
jgi:FHA domain